MADRGYPYDISTTVRLDRGPRVQRARASAAAFADGKLADHYKIGGPDARGRTIEDGKMFHYVDWKAPAEDHVVTVYQLDENDRYQIVERYVSEDAAYERALSLGDNRYGVS